MLEWQWSYILVVGTLVAGLGFLQWPKSSYELIHPRFVVPAVIWIATFGQAMVRGPERASHLTTVYTQTRMEYGDLALWYVILSILCFYLGMLLPLGRWISSPFLRLETHLKINVTRIRTIAWVGTWLLLALFLIVSGPRVLGLGQIGGFLPLPPNALRVMAIVFSVGSVFNAAMLGVSWPEREQRTVMTYVMMFIGLLVNSLFTMPIFSRGVGLAVFVAALAYSVRVRRFSPMVLIPAAIWVALCTHAGLYGRGVYGRASDVPTYILALFRHSIFDPVSVIRSGFGLSDCFTSLTVSMKAVTAADVRPLTKLDWMLIQLPIPRWLGILPEWTLNLTLYLGGYGAWGYTSGALGDTYIHWGWAGPLWFVPIGVCYRLLACLAFNPQTMATGGISVYSLVLFSGYYAIGVGVFNTYRAWVVSFTIPFVLVCLFLALRKIFMPPESAAAMEEQQIVQPSTWPNSQQASGWM